MQLPLTSAADVAQIAEYAGQKQFVLIGEATHGTSEFYVYRAQLTRELIEHHGFQVVAVEGDWPDCLSINEYCLGNTDHPSALQALQTFERWPSWMWANWEVAAFIDWLHMYNSSRAKQDKVRFYGLDLYGLWESLRMLLNRSKYYDVTIQQSIQAIVQCFSEYGMTGQEYAHAVWDSDSNCADDIALLMQRLEANHNQRTSAEDAFMSRMHTLAIRNGEHYYRIMMQADDDSWNIRDTHMANVVDELLQHYGTDTKIVAWAHNTHVGDARATDMRADGLVNIGQLIRERHGNERTALVGFDFYKGSVMAGSQWGWPQHVFTVPPAQAGSWGDWFHNNFSAKHIAFTDLQHEPALQGTRGQRAIGVVYGPQNDRYQYVPTHLTQRYDALLYIDTTTGLHPLPINITEDISEPDLYPWGF